MIIGGLVVHPFPRAKEVLRFYAEFMRTAPDALVAAAVLMTGPDGNKACGIAVAYPGDLAEGERIVAPLKQFGSAGAGRHRSDALPRAAVAARGGDAAQPAELLEGGVPPRHFGRRASTSPWTRSAACASPMSSILFFPIRGAASRVAPTRPRSRIAAGTTSASTRCGPTGAERRRTSRGCARRGSAIQPFAAGGVYVNELGEDDGADRVRMAYGLNYDRLQQIKAKYDPDNLFRLTANVLPAAV